MQEYLPSRPTESRYSFHPQPPMGILDDAIRQHLDLKRQRGATESELKELEDEAFGPPTRPGEPDFPGEDSRDQNGNGAGAEAAVSEPEATPADGPLEPSSESRAVRGRAPVVESPPEGHEPPALEDEPQAAEPTPASEELTTVYDHTEDREPGRRGGGRGRRGRARFRSAHRVAGHRRAPAPRGGGRARAPAAGGARSRSEDEAVPAIDEQDEPPSEEEPHPDQEGMRTRGMMGTRRTRTSSRTPRSSSRTLPRTTSSGSSRASRRTSTSRRSRGCREASTTRSMPTR